MKNNHYFSIKNAMAETTMAFIDLLIEQQESL